jgi:WD40 repeat protein
VWNPDGSRLASTSYDKTAKVWDTATGRELLTLRGHSDLILSVVWNFDGKQLATACKDGTVRVWDASIGYEISTNPTYGQELGTPATERK